MVNETAHVEQLASLRTGSKALLVVTLETVHGRRKLKFREWFNGGSEAGLKPGRDGIAIPADRLDALVAVLQTARLKLWGGGAL